MSPPSEPVIDPDDAQSAQGADVDAASLETLAAGSKSFSFAGRFLPARARGDAAVVYALCRLIDDLADEAPSIEQADLDLAALRAELEGDAPPRPLVVRARQVLERTGTGVAPALHLMDGVCTDLRPVRVANDAELLRYAYQVASTVGLMMCGVLGVDDAEALPHAVDLGVAMQITNICRDVREDAMNGRVYLPADRLAAAGTSTDALLAGTPDRPAVAAVVRDLLEMADRYYTSADAGMRYIPLRSRLAIVVASRVYRAIGTRLLRRHGGDAWHGRTVVPTGTKVTRALGALAALPTPRIAGWGGRVTHDRGLHQLLPAWPGVNG